MKEAEEKSKIVEIMKKNFFGAHLATCEGAQPRVRPVAPIVEDDLSLWIVTHCSSRKVEQIRVNSRIALSFVEYPGGDRVAIVTGEAQPIGDQGQKKRVWGIAPFDLSQFFPEGPESADFCLFKILIQKIAWRESWASEIKVYTPS